MTELADEQPRPDSIARQAPVPSGGVQDRSGEYPFPTGEPSPNQNETKESKERTI